MKRLLLILTIASVTLCQTVHAQYYSVNYDTRTVAAMVAAFGTEAVAEGYYREQVDDVLKHYTAAEVATAGIFAAKFLEHKALSDLGIWNSRTETTTTGASTGWWRRKSCPRYGWWRSRCSIRRKRLSIGAVT